MAEQSTRITGAYGSERVPVPGNPDPAAPKVAAGAQNTDPVPFNAQTVQGDNITRANEAGAARAAKPETGVLDGLSAAVANWDTTRLVKRLGRPTFDDDTPIEQYDYLQNLPMHLTEDEREYFLSVGQGVKSAGYAIDQIKAQRESREVVGDHPVVGLVGSFVDPLWLAVPPAIRVGKLGGAGGRAVAAVTGAGIAGTITAAGEGPVSDQDIALSMLMNGAASAALFKNGVVRPADPDFPAAALETAINEAKRKPKLKLVSPAEWEDVEVPAKEARFGWVQVGTDANGKPQMRRQVTQVAEAARTERRLVKPAEYRELPPELDPTIVQTDRAAVADAVEREMNREAKARGIGGRLQWNMRKTMGSFGDVGRRVANLLYDNNSDLGINSVESVREGVLNDLRSAQFEYEDLLRGQMKAEGFGTMKMMNPLTSREAYAKQLEIERAVQQELYRREWTANQGAKWDNATVPPHITAMADKLDALHSKALAELKSAGVEGAEGIMQRAGYLNRKWSSQHIDDVLTRLEGLGLTREASRMKLNGLVSMALRRANNMDKKTADQVGGAIIDRALDKGYFEDSALNMPGSAEQMVQLRNALRNTSLTDDELERALDVLRVQGDEQGKAGYLKRRMDLDYRATMRIGDDHISVMDLIDGRVGTIVDQYTAQVATSAALARKGLRKRSDVDALRQELSHSITDPIRRKEAVDLFDNTLNHYRGLPAGAQVPEAFRMMGAFTRAISLAWSGLWQATEYANPMAEYGLLKTLKYGMQELPGFKKMMNPNAAQAKSLDTVLADHSAQNMRMRPYIARYEDGYEMGMGNALQLSLQTMGQSVPYANAMRYVHHHQAKMVGNLIVDRLRLAADGNQKAIDALGKFGIESHSIEKVSDQIKKHGLTVDSWDAAVWAEVRPGFAKMMDASVLKGRLGDVPAFAAFDSVGKFLFTYRTFVLAAHNKLLAGGLDRDGIGAVGLLMMYQFPLAMAAVQAQSVIKGEGTLSDKDLVKKGIGQMGGLGLFSEPFKWATGESNSIGAPGLIAVDRGVRLFQGAAQMDANKAGTAALSLLPVANTNPIFNGMVNRMKE